MMHLISDHPDNHKSEKRSGDFSPAECQRRCTDVFMFLLLVCSWAAMTGEISTGEIGLINAKNLFKDIFYTRL